MSKRFCSGQHSRLSGKAECSPSTQGGARDVFGVSLWRLEWRRIHGQYESVLAAHPSGGSQFFEKFPQGRILPSVPWGGPPYSGLWCGGMLLMA